MVRQSASSASTGSDGAPSESSPASSTAATRACDGDAAFATLTQRLGDRVRNYRARRGMSRKVLSQQSGVSERYLAQLETGHANVSFHILWSLAQTMGTPVTDLLEDRPDEGPDLMLAKRLLDGLSMEEQTRAYALLRQHFGHGAGSVTRVALIGLRGAGKTTLGRLLADHFSVPFIRITQLVEQTAGMDLAEIFVTLGQTGYRRLELNAVRTAIAQNPRVVIETGGSLVSEPETFEALLSSCFTVWVKASPQEHMQRVVDQGDTRPMEGHLQRAMEDLETILESRRVFYGRSDAVLDTSQRKINDCASELIRLCTPHLNPDDVAVGGR